MASGKERMDKGVGIAAQNVVTATRPGKDSGSIGEDRSQGETDGAGSIYAATLAERPNTADPRNRGPERSPSRTGAGTIPVVTTDMRKSGKIS